MNRYTVAALGAAGWALAALVAACATPPQTTEPNVGPTYTFDEPPEITVREDQQRYINLDGAPYQILNILMNDEGDPVERCLDMGGTYRLVGVEHLCEDVDR